MAKENSGMRFDTREIAVILSLFVFVSILMFTVGILVGKGVSQKQAASEKSSGTLTASEHGEHHGDEHPAGTSVTTDHASESAENAEHGENNPHAENAESAHHAEHAEAPAKHDEVAVNDEETGPPKEAIAPPAGHEPAAQAPAHGSARGSKHAAAKEPVREEREIAEAKPEEPLKLIPEKPKTNDVRGELEEFPKTKEITSVLKNPKLQGIYEAPAPGKRATASIPPTKAPVSFPQGKYTVQIGSYPSQREAEDRVGALKKLGFPHAFFSAKELTKDTWYRVWLGYFPDADTARQGGELLQARGEVKNYLVRRSDNKD